MILAKDESIEMKGTLADLDSEVAMILLYYAMALQKAGKSVELIGDNLLDYMKLLKCITECVKRGDSLEDNIFRIVDEVFE